VNHIRVPEGYEIDPMLMELVNKLSMEKPDWVFDCMYSASYLNVNTYNVAVKRSFNVEEDKSYLRKVVVKDRENQTLGTLKVDRETWGRFANSGKPHIFIVESWRINKERGNRHQTKTTNIDSAVREAKKHFFAKTRKELLTDVTSEVKRGFNDAVYSLSRTFTRMCHEVESVTWAHTVLNMRNNLPLDPVEERRVNDLLTHEKFDSNRRDYLLSEAMQKHNTGGNMIVVAEQDGQFMSWGDTSEGFVVTLSFDELPPKIQERVGVLQLMENNEIVLDVGYRLDQGSYYVVAE